MGTLIVTERQLATLRKLLAETPENDGDHGDAMMNAAGGGNFDDCFDAGYQRGYNEAIDDIRCILGESV
ncbi:hypothetical protein WL21_09750 [Burkholderia ubonensis]|uniref:hypothetical protein n=1 Tax=Burkholderia ubonensis TaxID=101571 RepID=UPI0007561236|nr:hypothetical protein [Burkholderia ubonensis]KVO83306.1 hypothetical protein WJ81_22970 [Burkholderia ubonensis]KVZ58952.1 hypothetical protein WL20_20365 [Burkholderia ubonensis]KVZ70581.1 hypothetical protein WL21_09750 [Burkholderia ubonensis]